MVESQHALVRSPPYMLSAVQACRLLSEDPCPGARETVPVKEICCLSRPMVHPISGFFVVGTEQERAHTNENYVCCGKAALEKEAVQEDEEEAEGEGRDGGKTHRDNAADDNGDEEDNALADGNGERVMEEVVGEGNPDRKRKRKRRPTAVGEDSGSTSRYMVHLCEMETIVIPKEHFSNPEVRDLQFVDERTAVLVIGDRFALLKWRGNQSVGSPPSAMPSQLQSMDTLSVHLQCGVREIAYNEDLKLLVSGGDDKHIHFLSVDAGGGQSVQHSHHVAKAISSVRWNPYDVHTASCTTEMGTLLLFDSRKSASARIVSNVNTINARIPELYTHEYISEHLILCGYGSGHIRVMDTRKGRSVMTLEDPFQRAIGDIRLGQDPLMLVAGAAPDPRHTFIAYGVPGCTIWDYNRGQAAIHSHSASGVGGGTFVPRCGFSVSGNGEVLFGAHPDAEQLIANEDNLRVGGTSFLPVFGTACVPGEEAKQFCMVSAVNGNIFIIDATEATSTAPTPGAGPNTGAAATATDAAPAGAEAPSAASVHPERTAVTAAAATTAVVEQVTASTSSSASASASAAAAAAAAAAMAAPLPGEMDSGWPAGSPGPTSHGTGSTDTSMHAASPHLGWMAAAEATEVATGAAPMEEQKLGPRR